jgi:Zn-dependent M28 family amino/carboxypeptidase
VLFAAWGAQELGQLGSRHYVLSPTVSLTRTLAVVQLDGLGGGGGFFPGMQGDGRQDTLLLHHAQVAANMMGEKIIVTADFTISDHQSFDEAGLPTLLFSWRLANEDNLPDGLANGVNPERLALTGRLAALTLMMLAQ